MIAAVCILLTTAGCQNGGSENSAVTSPNVNTSQESTESPIQSETTSTNSEYSSEPSEFSEEPKNTVQQIKVSDMFTAPGRRIWFEVFHRSTNTSLSYDDPVYVIYVVENGKVTGYNGAQLYLEDFDQMTDDEIIAYVEEEFTNKQICEITFSYSPDATGNNLETESIEFDTDQYIDVSPYPDLEYKTSIDTFLETTTILSKEYFGIKFGGIMSKSVLITKYDFASPTEIILNEAGDAGLIRD